MCPDCAAKERSRERSVRRSSRMTGASTNSVKVSAPTIHCENCGKERPAKGAVKVTAGLAKYHICSNCRVAIGSHCPKVSDTGNVCLLRRGHKGRHDFYKRR